MTFEETVALNKRRMESTGMDLKDSLNISFVENFDKSLAYEMVELLDGSKIGVHIIKNTNYTTGKLMDYIIKKPPENVIIGEKYKYQDKIMMVTLVDRITGGYNKGLMESCNDSIKWIDELSKEHEEFCIYSKFGKGNDGKTETKSLILGASQSSILIQSNEHTRKFSKAQGNRFILSGKVFEIVDIETSLFLGLLTITLQEDSERVGKDDMVNRIAENIYTDIPEPPHPTAGLVIEGNGDDGVIYCNLSFVFEAKLYEGNVLVNPQPSIIYSIDKPDLIETTQADNKYTIKPKPFTTDNRDKKIILTANDGNGHVTSKELTIRIL